jgi:hypothetical protein
MSRVSGKSFVSITVGWDSANLKITTSVHKLWEMPLPRNEAA